MEPVGGSSARRVCWFNGVKRKRPDGWVFPLRQIQSKRWWCCPADDVLNRHQTYGDVMESKIHQFIVDEFCWCSGRGERFCFVFCLHSKKVLPVKYLYSVESSAFFVLRGELSREGGGAWEQVFQRSEGQITPWGTEFLFKLTNLIVAFLHPVVDVLFCL